MLEIGDRLWNAFVQHFEIARAEAVNRAAFGIRNAHIHLDQSDPGLESRSLGG